MSAGVIVGVGSDCGLDRVGLDILTALGEAPRRVPLGIGLHACRAPAATLPAVLPGAEWAILIDALRGDGSPGTVTALEPGDLASTRHGNSSHGLGVAQTLALLSALGRMPARTIIVAIEVGTDEFAQVPPAWIDVGCEAVLGQLRRFCARR